MSADTDIETILARVDRTSPDALLNSLAKELVLLHRSYQALQARIVALEVCQSMSDKILTAAPPLEPELAKTIAIDAMFSLSAEQGFYPLEYDNNGSGYRWTGPEPTFWFELLIDRSTPCALRMRYSQLFSQPPGRQVRCYVDGQLLPAQTLAVEGEFEILATLPPRQSKGGTVVTFACPGTKSPMEAGISSETRKIGLAFRSLKVDAIANEEASEADSLFGAPVADLDSAPTQPDAEITPIPRAARSRSTARRA